MMKYFWSALLIGTLLFWRWQDDALRSLWTEKWGVLLIGCALALSVLVARKISWSVAVAFFLALYSSIDVSIFLGRHERENEMIRMVLAQAAAQAGVGLVIIVAFLATLKERGLLALERTFAASVPIITWVLIYYHFHWHPLDKQVPFFDNPSMTASFLAVVLWLWEKLAESKKWPLWVTALVWVPALGVILMTQTSTALVALALGGTTILTVKKKPFSFRYIIMPLGALGAIAGLCMKPWTFWSMDSGRFKIWTQVSDFILLTGRYFDWGTGIGTGRQWIPIIQVMNGQEANCTGCFWFLWLHNDWLQTVLEMGIWGARAVLVMTSSAFIRARNTQPWLAAALAAYAGVMWTNFPLHMAPHAFLGALLIRLCFSGWTNRFWLSSFVGQEKTRLAAEEKENYYGRPI